MQEMGSLCSWRFLGMGKGQHSQQAKSRTLHRPWCSETMGDAKDPVFETFEVPVNIPKCEQQVEINEFKSICETTVRIGRPQTLEWLTSYWWATQVRLSPFHAPQRRNTCRVFPGLSSEVEGSILTAVDTCVAFHLPAPVSLFRHGNPLGPTSADSQDREELCRSEAAVPSQGPVKNSMTAPGYWLLSAPPFLHSDRKGQPRASFKKSRP